MRGDEGRSLRARLNQRLQKTRPILFSRLAPISLLIGVLLAIVWTFSAHPPFDFGGPRIVKVPPGATLRSEARALKEAHVIRSETLFTFTAMILGGERGLIAGSYYFPTSQNVFTVARRMVSGRYDLTPTKVTIPEGATIKDMIAIYSDKLVYFDAARFDELSAGKEGYLFPDTYYFLPTEDVEVIIGAMEQNFYEKIATLKPTIEESGHSLHDIVTMASLLEEEARTTESRRMISGILWKRISIGMRLQVDAVFPYILGKNTFEVTKEDLLTNSPYNTYLYAGLPLGPISNPGKDALSAALNPTKSSYLYYLSDNGGGMHYSKTYAEHLRYVKRYLR